MSGIHNLPIAFQPRQDQPEDVRIAEALEFIAARMSTIEFNLI